ncbi:hypothetical protein DMN91_010623 [Ooceraea biroi]|uniref:Uncharacterized protein n=1 Tax=Ooceraea biroi TaxID=2015173 RepID=A0A3L8D7X4_OOCBI|nr:hypothetical protein DMN91_010623 [Ooceraea biroi]
MPWIYACARRDDEREKEKDCTCLRKTQAETFRARYFENTSGFFRDLESDLFDGDSGKSRDDYAPTMMGYYALFLRRPFKHCVFYDSEKENKEERNTNAKST